MCIDSRITHHLSLCKRLEAARDLVANVAIAVENPAFAREPQNVDGVLVLKEIDGMSQLARAFSRVKRQTHAVQGAAAEGFAGGTLEACAIDALILFFSLHHVGKRALERLR